MNTAINVRVPYIIVHYLTRNEDERAFEKGICSEKVIIYPLLHSRVTNVPALRKDLFRTMLELLTQFRSRPSDITFSHSWFSQSLQTNSEPGPRKRLRTPLDILFATPDTTNVLKLETADL